MYDCRSQASISGKQGEIAAKQDAHAAHESSSPRRQVRREDDFIRGMRRGLVVSLAIWAVLLAVGALLFT